MSVKHKIRVVVVDDSSFFREMIKTGLQEDKMIEVVAVAKDGEEAIVKIEEFRPDVVTCDIEMPGMTGIDVLKTLMKKNPVPVVMVSSLSSAVFDAMEAGAVDFVNKPDSANSQGRKSMCAELIIKVKIASMAKLHIKPSDNSSEKEISSELKSEYTNKIIAIGASTGGTEAIFSVLKELPKEMPGIVMVQHMPEKFTALYSERLNKGCKLEVREAKDGDIILPGLVLLAPGGYQMRVEKKKTYSQVRCVKEGKVSGHEPSVDVLFDSVANAYKGNAYGIILTGMGKDGANGMLKMRKAGARTIGQDEASCIVYGMPKVAYQIGAVEVQAPLKDIPTELKKMLPK